MHRRIIVVTGANRGIGFATASKLAAEGHQLVLACRNAERGLQAARSISAAHAAAPTPMVVPFELGNGKARTEEGVDMLRERFGYVDTVVHNAWCDISEIRASAEDEGDLRRRMVEYNYRGTATAAEAYHPLLHALPLPYSEQLKWGGRKPHPSLANATAAREVFLVSRNATGSSIGLRVLHQTLTNKLLQVVTLQEAVDKYCHGTNNPMEEQMIHGWPPDPVVCTKCFVGCLARARAAIPRLSPDEMSHGWESARDQSLQAAPWCAPGDGSKTFRRPPPVKQQTQNALLRPVNALGCCPGWCRTGAGSPDAPRSAEEGAATPAWLAASPEVEGVNGQYYADRKAVDWVGLSVQERAGRLRPTDECSLMLRHTSTALDRRTSRRPLQSRKPLRTITQAVGVYRGPPAS